MSSDALQRVWSSVQQIVRRYKEEGTDSFKAAVVMVAALFVGPSVEKITELSGYTPEFVDVVAQRLIESGLWKDDHTDYQEWDDRSESGLIKFTMDLLVAEGMVVRTGEKRRTSFGQLQYVYRARRPEHQRCVHRSRPH